MFIFGKLFIEMKHKIIELVTQIQALILLSGLGQKKLAIGGGREERRRGRASFFPAPENVFLGSGHIL
jgi:hypothetical protein